MGKNNDERPGYGKLLDGWSAPEDSGKAIGCIATSFTFDPVFFEEECLSRFLDLETDAREDGVAYLLEREEKLSQVACAAAIVDRHYCRGTRNLRWSLLCARVDRGILHAKVSLLAWSDRIRLIIGSANLTEDGYRRNQEIYGVLDYFAGSDSPPLVLKETVRFLREVIQTSEPRAESQSDIAKRCTSFLETVDRLANRWKAAAASPPRGLSLSAVFTGPRQRPVFEQLRELWPAKTLPHSAYVVSPFFDPPEAENLPASQVWELLRRRGSSVAYYVVVERDDEGAPGLIRAPSSLRDAVPPERHADVVFYELKAEAKILRPLHAKCIYLNDERWHVYLVGSSNFTRAGCGLAGGRNLEANLAYVADENKARRLVKNFNDAFPPHHAQRLETEHLNWQAVPNEDEAELCEVPLLPAAFGAAVYDVDRTGEGFIRLQISEAPPKDWRVFTKEEGLLTNETDWNAAGRPSVFTILWREQRPPSGLLVTWEQASGEAWWPVNVSNTAALPPPDELRDLPLEVLINILTSARPLHAILGEYLRDRSPKQLSNGTYLDPHKNVDTSQFLLQRTRRVSTALQAVAERLARPVATEESLRWRLRGPIGAEAVANAIAKEAESGGCGVMRPFLIAEMALELSKVEPTSVPGSLPAAHLKREIGIFIQELSDRVGTGDDGAPRNLVEYVGRAFTKAAS